MRCPACSAPQGFFQPWRALGTELVACPRCGRRLELVKSSASIRTHIGVGSVLATLIAGAIAASTDSIAYALFGFAATEFVLMLYVRLVLFRWVS